jgi:hypothetical protein
LESRSLIYKRCRCENVTSSRGARQAISAKKNADPVSAPDTYNLKRKAGPNMPAIWCKQSEINSTCARKVTIGDHKTDGEHILLPAIGELLKAIKKQMVENQDGMPV